MAVSYSVSVVDANQMLYGYTIHLPRYTSKQPTYLISLY